MVYLRSKFVDCWLSLTVVHVVLEIFNVNALAALCF